MSELQSKIYFYLDELQKMTAEISSSLQQRIPNETLSGLASALADGPIFEIVDGLTEVQQAVEKQLFRQRLEMLKRHSDEKSSFSAHYQQKVCCITDQSEVLRVTAELDRSRDSMISRHQEEIRQFDIGVILQLDQKVSEQQVTLEKAGVPGFYVTNNPTEVQVQMSLVQFIVKLKKIEQENKKRQSNPLPIGKSYRGYLTKRNPESRILTELQNKTEFCSKNNLAGRPNKTEKELKSSKDCSESRGYFTDKSLSNQENVESRDNFTNPVLPIESKNRGYFTEKFEQRRGYFTRGVDSNKSDLRSEKDRNGKEGDWAGQTPKIPIIQGCLLSNGGGLSNEYRKVLIEIRPNLNEHKDAQSGKNPRP